MLTICLGDGAQCRSSVLKRRSASKSAAVGHYDTFPKRFTHVSSVCSGSHIDYSMPNISLLLKEVRVCVCVCATGTYGGILGGRGGGQTSQVGVFQG